MSVTPSMLTLVSSATTALDATLTPILTSRKSAFGQLLVEVQVTGAVGADVFVYYSNDESVWAPANLLELQGLASGAVVLASLPLLRPSFYKISGNGSSAGTTVVVRVYQASLRYTSHAI